MNAGVLIAPIVPGFSASPAQLEATVKAIADSGAAFMGANVMFLKGGTKDHFLGFIAREFPQMLEGYQHLYAGAYAGAEYLTGVRGMIATLERRYQMNRRESDVRRSDTTEQQEERAACEQAALDWGSGR